MWGDALAAGRARRSPELGPLEIMAGGIVALGDGPHIEEAKQAARDFISFYVGGMGARSQNFYNDLFRRYGWEDEAEKIQDMFLAGNREGAAAAVPEEYLELSMLCGDETTVRERLDAYRGVGVTHLNVNPIGPDTLGTVEALKSLVSG